MKALRHILAGLTGIAVMAGFAGSASADLILLIDDDNDGVDAVLIDDQPSGTTVGSWTSDTADGLNGTAGAVLFAGTIGTWELVVATGQSKPLIGPGEMDLTLTATSDSADTLAVWLIDTDFLTGASSFLVEWALDAANGGTSSLNAGASASNSDTSWSLLSSLGPLGDGFYTDAAAFFATAGVPFSMAMQWIVTHTQAGSTTGDLRILVPEPMTAAMFGMGLLGIGAVRRRKNKQAA